MRVGLNHNIQNSAIFNQHSRPFANVSMNAADDKKVMRLDKNQTQPKTMLEVLMEQKQQVTEQKYSLIGRHLEKGGDIQAIESQIEAYDEQIKTIDAQMKAAQLSEQQKQEEQQDIAVMSKPKTKEEADASKLNDILSISTSHKQTEEIVNIKERMERESTTLQTEIKLDNAIQSIDASTSKTSRVAKLDAKTDSLDSNIQQRNANIIKPEKEETIEEEPSKELEKDKSIDMLA